MLPCLVCGKTLESACPEADNQPYGGTEFRTYGHYGSTFWDSFYGEELVITICDPCLRAHTDRLATQKQWLPIRCNGLAGMGRQWVERPLIPYSNDTADYSELTVTVEELGTDIPNVEWDQDIADIKASLENG